MGRAAAMSRHMQTKPVNGCKDGDEQNTDKATFGEAVNVADNDNDRRIASRSIFFGVKDRSITDLSRFKMASPNFANTRMVVGVNHKLRFWWRNLKKDRELEVRWLLGGLTFLLFVIHDRYLIMALLKFWDPTKMVFRFRDFELTPTIKEIGGFLDLPYRDRTMIVPHKQSPKKFLRSLGLRYNPNIASLDFGWISLDFLYSRFGREDGHEVFKKEFACSIEKWKKYHLKDFDVALLG